MTPPAAHVAHPDQRQALAFRHVSKQFPRGDGGALEVLRDVSFDVPAGSVVSILGPSGSGKSTLLNMAAGLLAPDQGRVLVLGHETTGTVDWSRLGYMFQDDRLLPWRTAIDNVGLALETGSIGRREKRERSQAQLSLVGLGDFASAYPHQLSGGMRSRVALARSLVTEPDILLMDEPFSRLDAQTRTTMHTELLRIHRERGMSIVFVTHDVEEAVILADHIVMFSPRPGRVHTELAVELPHPRLGTPDALSLVAELRAAIAGMSADWVI
ncbi:ABC transporter ATP-binding protein [Rhodoplanes sp. TEM]|uniref:ABC transporter ATP-binding protein n=1 Tax=Rhodoplanes tepidamans TaxID=200616 RepID=A0ABT5J8Z2_RHOTP|nr:MULTISPECIES: ABC transporter ATP-binding protein [Rhodoplanes]MDC7785525.1 ABC transporter ATP-binding protein [Rhodoplanes tepidamans]MDC7986193.1 ABC transporter ATP-binding protein [Rhodoplanes sp. TEM]MDQ0353305.1 ABC-type nitrate/sulfonate/bicarbonate transport system ATPase subunit [Rhodoplanes tepidamans]